MRLRVERLCEPVRAFRARRAAIVDLLASGEEVVVLGDLGASGLSRWRAASVRQMRAEMWGDGVWMLNGMEWIRFVMPSF